MHLSSRRLSTQPRPSVTNKFSRIMKVHATEECPSRFLLWESGTNTCSKTRQHDLTYTTGNTSFGLSKARGGTRVRHAVKEHAEASQRHKHTHSLVETLACKKETMVQFFGDDLDLKNQMNSWTITAVCCVNLEKTGNAPYSNHIYCYIFKRSHFQACFYLI